MDIWKLFKYIDLKSNFSFYIYIFYLLSLAEKLEEAAKTSRHLGETIIDTLKEKDIIVIVEEKESLPKQVLH